LTTTIEFFILNQGKENNSLKYQENSMKQLTPTTILGVYFSFYFYFYYFRKDSGWEASML